VISGFLAIPDSILPHLSLAHFGFLWGAMRRIAHLYALPSAAGWEKLDSVTDKDTFTLLISMKDRCQQWSSTIKHNSTEVSNFWQYYHHVLENVLSGLQRENQQSIITDTTGNTTIEALPLGSGNEFPPSDTWNNLSWSADMEDFGFTTSMFDPFSFP
jgi:hypothetical protein